MMTTEGQYNMNILNETTTANHSALSCEKQGAQILLSPTATGTLKYIQLVYCLGALPVSLLLNVYLIVLVAKFKCLHQLSYYLILQVIIIDLIFCIISFPVMVTNILVYG